MNDNNDSHIRRLFLPAGIYFIVNPYQESHGVVATLGGAVQRPGNINAAHAGLRPFYNAFLNADINRDADHTVYLAVFWFGPLHTATSKIAINNLHTLKIHRKTLLIFT